MESEEGVEPSRLFAFEASESASSSLATPTKFGVAPGIRTQNGSEILSLRLVPISLNPEQHWLLKSDSN